VLCGQLIGGMQDWGESISVISNKTVVIGFGLVLWVQLFSLFDIVGIHRGR